MQFGQCEQGFDRLSMLSAKQIKQRQFNGAPGGRIGVNGGLMPLNPGLQLLQIGNGLQGSSVLGKKSHGAVNALASHIRARTAFPIAALTAV